MSDKCQLPATAAGSRVAIPAPDREAWKQLCSELIEAGQIDRAGVTYPGMPQGFAAAEKSLNAILDFLMAHGDLIKLDALGSIHKLRAALADLREGGRPALLQPQKRSGRPTTSQLEATIQGMAARCMTELMEGGETRKSASIRVASALRSGGHKTVNARSVQDWRARCMEGDGAPISPAAIQHYHFPLERELPGLTAKERGEQLLLALRGAKRRGF